MKILIADDHALFRQGMIYILENMDQKVETLEASTSGKAIQLAKEHPDITLALMDLRMPDMDGLDAMRLILNSVPTVPVVILTASERLTDMKQALDAGAMGYIAKSVAPAIMVGAIQLVLSGGIYIPPELMQHSRQVNMPGLSGIKLTPRQIEVLRLLVDGMANKEIARTLRLSEATVKAHVSSIFKVLDVSNRTQAALAAKKIGLGATEDNDVLPTPA